VKTDTARLFMDHKNWP